MSAPGRIGGAAASSPPRRFASLVANAAVAGRFLPVWLATGVLVIVAAIIAPADAPEHVVGLRPAVHDDPRDRGARPDARDHAGGDRPLDAGRDLVRREPDRRREPRAGRPAGARASSRASVSAWVWGSSTGSSSGSCRLNPLIVTLAVGLIVAAWSLRYARENTNSLAGAAGAVVVGGGEAARHQLRLLDGRRDHRSPSRSCSATPPPAGASRRSARTREPPGWPGCASGRTSSSHTRRQGSLYAMAAILLAGIRINIDPALRRRLPAARRSRRS